MLKKSSMVSIRRIIPTEGTKTQRGVSPQTAVGRAAKMGDSRTLAVSTEMGVILRVMVAEMEMMIAGKANVIGGRPRRSPPQVTVTLRAKKVNRKARGSHIRVHKGKSHRLEMMSP